MLFAQHAPAKIQSLGQKWFGLHKITKKTSIHPTQLLHRSDRIGVRFAQHPPPKLKRTLQFPLCLRILPQVRVGVTHCHPDGSFHKRLSVEFALYAGSCPVQRGADFKVGFGLHAGFDLCVRTGLGKHVVAQKAVDGDGGGGFSVGPLFLR